MSQSTPRRIRQVHRHLLTTHRGPTGPAAAAAESIGDLRTPALVLRLDVAAANVARMQARADSLGCALRPHVKTHKTLELGALQTGGTRRRITVSTLAEAQFFADGGFDDILYAVPITPDKLGEAAALTRRLDAFHVICDHPTQLEAILALPRPAPDKPWSVFIMVDCGYHRVSVCPLPAAACWLLLTGQRPGRRMEWIPTPQRRWRWRRRWRRRQTPPWPASTRTAATHTTPTTSMR